MSHRLDGDPAILIVALIVMLWCAAIAFYAVAKTRRSYRKLGLPIRGERP